MINIKEKQIRQWRKKPAIIKNKLFRNVKLASLCQ